MLSSKFCTFIHINDLVEDQITLEDLSLIIWDLDGTLYCMKTLKRKIIQSMYSPWNFIEVLRFFKVEGIIQKERKSSLFNMDNYRRDYLKMQQFINSYLDENLVLDKSVKLLKRAKEVNIQQVVISEYPIGQKLELLDLKHFFSASYSCSEDMKCWKPSVAAARFVMQELGEHKKILVIGDRKDTDGKLSENLNKLKGE